MHTASEIPLASCLNLRKYGNYSYLKVVHLAVDPLNTTD